MVEVVRALENIWDLIEGQGTGVRHRDRATWGNDRWSPGTAAAARKDPAAIARAGAGAGGHGMLQSQATWYIRGRPGCGGCGRAFTTRMT